MGLPSLIPDANKMCDFLLLSLSDLEQL